MNERANYPEPVFFEGGGFRVTETLLTTPSRTFALGNVEYVAVTRPLLLVTVPPALALIGVAAAFRRYLTTDEIMVLIAMPMAAMVLASAVGTLRVHSLALRGDEVGTTIGLVWRLRKVRRAVEQAMVFRSHGEARP